MTHSGGFQRISNLKNDFLFNGIERVDDLDLGWDMAFYRSYDPMIARWHQVDPKTSERESPYVGFGNNPIYYADPLGDTLDIINKDGDILFTINDGSNTRIQKNWRYAYDKKYQWFEPTADNYTPLISVAKNITQSKSLKHFTWQDIASFSEVERPLIDYAGGQPGDWKSAGNGGDGYPLVTVDGKPYWGDAVGQIPFAVGHFREVLKGEDVNEADAANETLYNGQKASGGFWSYIGNTLTGGAFRDDSNTYDNHFIMRGINYAGKRFDRTTSTGEVNLILRNVNPNILGKPTGMKLPVTYKMKEK